MRILEWYIFNADHLKLTKWTNLCQGTIYYSGANHWKNSFLSVAEVTRIAEDFGRFQLPVRLFRRPMLGWMHGSWILISGKVQNAVTWDTACIAEDFWFAYNVGVSHESDRAISLKLYRQCQEDINLDGCMQSSVNNPRRQ